MRSLYVAISQSKPSKEGGLYVTSEFIKMYKHIILQSLRHLSDKFGKYGDMVLALDSKNNWRKDYYPEYKSNRKKDRDSSDVNFEEFFSEVSKFTDTLDKSFPYKVIEVHRAEADDIIGVLAQKFSLEKTVVVSSDKDFKQVLEYGVELYDPIKKEFVKMSPEELKEWKLIHVLLGDEGDNVPHIKRGTEFTDNFKAYLKKNEIYLTEPEKFNKLSISRKLYSEYDTYKTNKKGEVLDELDIFKATPFGEAGAKKFIADLKSKLTENRIYVENFERNKNLVLFKHIPEDIRTSIETGFEEISFQYDPNDIMEFLVKNSLTQHIVNITDFYIDGRKMKERHDKKESLSEWV